MAKPLALTLGEPAGIGPDLAIAAWLRRTELNLPPFYLLGDRDFIAGPRQIIRSRCPAGGCNGHQAPQHPFAGRVAGGLAGHTVTAQPGRPDASSAPAVDCLDPPGRRRLSRPATRARGHQPDHQERALPRRLQPSRPYRISRQTRRARRQDADAGDAAVVARSRGGAGDHSCVAARRHRTAIEPADHRHCPHCRRRYEGPLRPASSSPCDLRPQSALRRRRVLGTEEQTSLRRRFAVLRNEGIDCARPAVGRHDVSPGGRGKKYDLRDLHVSRSGADPRSRPSPSTKASTSPSACRSSGPSPDHGTAFDIAGSGRANPSSLIAALKLAARMAAAKPS